MSNTRQLEKDAQTLAEHGSRIANDVRDLGGATKRVVTDGADALRETASEYLDEGYAKAREAGERVQTHVREQPTKSLLIAAGVGFLFGLLWLRR